jgi:hypothetical protein
VDTSSPTVKIGAGAAAGCTFAALSAAVTAGGIITFDCGSSPVTIPITSTMSPPITKNTVIDGGGLVTLDGQHTTQILSWNGTNWGTNDFGVTLQRIRLVNGKKSGTMMFPTYTPQMMCSTGYFDGEGGAVYVRDGNLTVIDSIFDGNQAEQTGPDTGGGAIYITGSKTGLFVMNSTFTNNKGANGGAIGSLFSQLQIYNSLFTGNTATGFGANGDNATQCPHLNNPPQHQTGSGGNGGAICNDGAAFLDPKTQQVLITNNLFFCGDDIENNAAGTGAFGGGIFMTSDDWSATLTIDDSTVTNNTGGHWTSVKQGTVMNLGTAFGVNALSVSYTNSTLQM